MYQFGRFTLDPDRLVLYAGRSPLPLARKVVQTLCALVENAGLVTSKAELMDRLWPDAFVEESNLSQNIYVLRQTFKARGAEDVIQTIPGRGYRFRGRVRSVQAPPTLMARRYPEFAMAGIALLCLALAAALAPRNAFALNQHDTQLYTLGRYYWSLRSPAALRRSLGYFRTVTEDAPHSALGYAGLADAYLGLYDYDCSGRSCVSFARLSSAYANKAVRVDNGSAEAHTSRAMALRVFDRDYLRSDAEFRRAIALNARYAPAHEWYGNSLLARGRIAGARRELEFAAAIDPVAPATYGWLARAEYYAHHYRRAIALAREALALQPARSETRFVLGLAYEASGDRANAIAQFRRLNDPAALIAGVAAREGDVRTAIRLLTRSAADDVNVAVDFVQLGQYTRALRLFKRARFGSDLEREFLALDPRLDSVRRDPRFREWTTNA